jgi:hypothetical protein
MFLAVAGEAAGHDLVALGEARFDRVEVFVVDELDFRFTIFAVAFGVFSSFCHGVSFSISLVNCVV